MIVFTKTVLLLFLSAAFFAVIQFAFKMEKGNSPSSKVLEKKFHVLERKDSEPLPQFFTRYKEYSFTLWQNTKKEIWNLNKNEK